VRYKSENTVREKPCGFLLKRDILSSPKKKIILLTTIYCNDLFPIFFYCYDEMMVVQIFMKADLNNRCGSSHVNGRIISDITATRSLWLNYPIHHRTLQQYYNVVATLQEHCSNIAAVLQCCCNIARILQYSHNITAMFCAVWDLMNSCKWPLN